MAHRVKTRTPVTIDPAAFDPLVPLVGRYRLAPTFILTFSRRGDRFYTQATGQPKVEMFPESPTEFFLFHAEFDEGDERLSLQEALEDFLVLAHAGGYGLCWTLDSANTVLRYWFAGDPSFVGKSLDEVDYSVARELEIEKFYKEDSSEGVSDELRNEVYELAEAEVGCKDD